MRYFSQWYLFSLFQFLYLNFVSHLASYRNPLNRTQKKGSKPADGTTQNLRSTRLASQRDFFHAAVCMSQNCCSPPRRDLSFSLFERAYARRPSAKPPTISKSRHFEFVFVAPRRVHPYRTFATYKTYKQNLRTQRSATSV